MALVAFILFLKGRRDGLVAAASIPGEISHGWNTLERSRGFYSNRDCRHVCNTLVFNPKLKLNQMVSTSKLGMFPRMASCFRSPPTQKFCHPTHPFVQFENWVAQLSVCLFLRAFSKTAGGGSG